MTLPDTITEIRGQAFKNDRSLKSLNLPNNLNYLGGGAFYNCTSLVSIEIPNSVTYLGGEAFYNAKSLETVTLSENVTEIRGSTFENCSSLESIVIPDKVTRIGGHAFYGNSSLKSVSISENSQLKEIGSSAFRLCDNLYKITLPKGVNVNFRAFKESPTAIYEYGEFEASDYRNNFKYKSYMNMHAGESKPINQYGDKSILKDAYVTLINIIKVNGSYEYILKYTESFYGTTFTLSRNTPYKVVNDNVVISIFGDYVFTSYDSYVALNAYYN